mgnify:CR=1 FL=1
MPKVVLSVIQSCGRVGLCVEMVDSVVMAKQGSDLLRRNAVVDKQHRGVDIGSNDRIQTVDCRVEMVLAAACDEK